MFIINTKQKRSYLKCHKSHSTCYFSNKLVFKENYNKEVTLNITKQFCSFSLTPNSYLHKFKIHAHLLFICTTIYSTK